MILAVWYGTSCLNNTADWLQFACLCPRTEHRGVSVVASGSSTSYQLLSATFGQLNHHPHQALCRLRKRFTLLITFRQQTDLFPAQSFDGP